MENAIELVGVTKTFKDHVAVDNLHLNVPAGSIYGFIGPNGSGKTTTLRMILRILYPDSGTVRVLGRDHGAAADDRVGYLPEERGLYKKMSVRDVLRFHAALKGCRESDARINSWLERFDMTAWATKKIETLSKGMAQKIQFIAAVVARPQLVILDEPFSGLDPVNMEALKDAVLSMRQDGTTVIFSTHDMDVAERMCDTIFMIFRGCKVLDGTLDQIQAEYGVDTLRVATGSNGAPLADLAGVERVNDFGRYKELRMAAGVDPQSVLRELVALTAVQHFEIARPTLHDIFVRIARPEQDGVTREDTPETV